MPGASDQVAATFTQAQSYASTAQGQLGTFLAALNSTLYAPPTISMSWSGVSSPSLPSMPSAPTMPTVSFNTPDAPGELTEQLPVITIDDFTEAAPSTSIPSAPVLDYGTAPTIPSIADVTIPDAPVIVLPDAPTYLAINTPSFAGVDIHQDYINGLSNIPTLDLVEPTPYSYALGPKYASTLLENLKATIAARINGGTGLNPVVEQALWERGRNRESSIAQGEELDALRTAETFGFSLPNGAVSAVVLAAQRRYIDKMSTLSRDISIKQADLEQENLKDAIGKGMDLEKSLIDYSFRLEQLAFEAAKTLAENSIQVYNTQVEKFKALLSAFQLYAAAYDTIIKAELAKVEVYKAQLAGEQAKADINRTKVEQYKVGIEATMSQVEIFKSQIGGAQALIDLERAKLGAAGEQIQAFVAKINGETAKVEAFKASVQAVQVEASIYQTKAQAFGSKVGAQAERARAEVTRFQAITSAKSQEWDGYRARLAAESARLSALATQSGTLLDGYRAEVAAVQAQAGMSAEMFKAQVHEYEAAQNLSVQVAKINGDFAIATNNAHLDASKAGAQAYAQLTASAYSMMNASASISGGDSYSVSYSYSGDAVAP